MGALVTFLVLHGLGFGCTHPWQQLLGVLRAGSGNCDASHLPLKIFEGKMERGDPNAGENSGV